MNIKNGRKSPLSSSEYEQVDHESGGTLDHGSFNNGQKRNRRQLTLVEQLELLASTNADDDQERRVAYKDLVQSVSESMAPPSHSAPRGRTAIKADNENLMVKRKKKAKRSGKETIDDGSEDEDGDTHDEKDDDIGAWGNEGEYYLDDELDGEDEEMHLRGLEGALGIKLEAKDFDDNGNNEDKGRERKEVAKVVGGIQSLSGSTMMSSRPPPPPPAAAAAALQKKKKTQLAMTREAVITTGSTRNRDNPKKPARKANSRYCESGKIDRMWKDPRGRLSWKSVSAFGEVKFLCKRIYR